MTGQKAGPESALVVRAILSWWDSSELRRRRDALPWRIRPEPWPVLVSEVMLAQTQVNRVLPRFNAFVGRYRAPAELASAPLAEVLSLFDGLGYPRRAVALRAAATIIAADHSGAVPMEEAALLSLPGVGRYTASAVRAFAFDLPVLPLDTNVARVVARAFAGARLTPSAAGRAASALAAERPGGRELATAVMDLGAGLCRPRLPLCDSCPLGGNSPLCAWRRKGGDDPAVASFAVSRRQSRYAGSDREGRGRLLRAAAAGPLRPSELAAVAGWGDDSARAERAAQSLVRDGLLTEAQVGYCIAK